MHLSALLAAAAVVTGVSLAASAFEPPSDQKNDPRSDTKAARNDKDSKERSAPCFMTTKQLTGANVYDAGTDKKLADIKDGIFDRGSGRMHAYLLDLGTFNKNVPVPVSDVWLEGDVKKGKFRTSLTQAELESMPAFDRAVWAHTRPRSDSDSRAADRAREADSTDPYAGRLETTTTRDVTGTVKNISYMTLADGEEYMVIDVTDADGGEQRRVVLGPTWYVRTVPVTVVRGDKVKVHTVAVSKAERPEWVATTIDVDGKTVRYRDESNNPRWFAPTSKDRSSSGDNFAQRYGLLTELKGRSVLAQGETCGKIDNAIVETCSGTVAFLSIDPDTKFLGIGDTKRLVPISIAFIPAEGPVRLDASREMILGSTETPSDPAVLAQEDRCKAAYGAFGVSPPKFRPMDRGKTRMSERQMSVRIDDGWTAASEGWKRSDVMPVTLTGRVDDIDHTKLNSSLGTVVVAEMKPQDRKMRIILGPETFVDKQPAKCAKGDIITVKAIPVTVNGDEYWLASECTCKDNTMKLWKNGVAVWTER